VQTIAANPGAHIAIAQVISDTVCRVLLPAGPDASGRRNNSHPNPKEMMKYQTIFFCLNILIII
jgi:hypothetical protein